MGSSLQPSPRLDYDSIAVIIGKNFQLSNLLGLFLEWIFYLTFRFSSSEVLNFKKLFIVIIKSDKSCNDRYIRTNTFRILLFYSS